jgi:glycerol kinase
MKCLLALDQGTTSSRSMLFNLEGRPIGSAQQEFQQHFPQPGWVEHDPLDIWQSQLQTAREVLAKTGTALSDIVSIGITNQRETTLIWERATGKPIYPAIVWQDRRTAGTCDRLKQQGLEELFRSKTGLVLDPYFSGTKIAWILENVKGAAQRAQAGELAFGTVDSWLMYNLSGRVAHLTDVSNASRTLVFNIHTLQWDDELLRILRVPKALLPEVRPSAGAFARTAPDVFGDSIPIAGCAGDQQAALFGQACFSAGMAKNTYGTGAFVVMNTGTTSVSGDGVISTIAWQLAGQPAEYALEGSIFIAGAVVQWLRDGLGIISSSAEIERLAQDVDDNGGVFFVPAFVGLGAPYWDSYARGTIMGLTRGTTRAHLARAALEAIAFQTRDAIGAMETASKIRLQQLRVDGGASVNNFLMQFQSDLLGVPVLRPRVTETTALGAAYLAGIGVGELDVASIQQRWALDRRFEPSSKSQDRDRLHEQWLRAVDRSRAWVQA